MAEEPEDSSTGIRRVARWRRIDDVRSAALCLVIVLENTSGPIEFEGLGFGFKGASGPLVLWCLCFLVMTAAIKAVWATGR
jgi:hypothetical protein